jgi:hypothetical protein
MEEEDDEQDQDWNMNFEEIISKEEVFEDNITDFPGQKKFNLNMSYLDSLNPYEDPLWYYFINILGRKTGNCI